MATFFCRKLFADSRRHKWGLGFTFVLHWYIKDVLRIPQIPHNMIYMILCAP